MPVGVPLTLVKGVNSKFVDSSSVVVEIRTITPLRVSLLVDNAASKVLTARGDTIITGARDIVDVFLSTVSSLIPSLRGGSLDGAQLPFALISMQ